MFTIQDEAAIVDNGLAEIVKNNENGRKLKVQLASGNVFPSGRVRKAMSGGPWSLKSEMGHARSSRTGASHASTRALQPSYEELTSHS